MSRLSFPYPSPGGEHLFSFSKQITTAGSGLKKRSITLLWSRCWAILLAMLLAIGLLPLGAQQWEYGRHNLPCDPSLQVPLNVQMKAPDDLKSFGFLGKVGGVAFQNVAVLTGVLAEQPVAPVYAPDRADGSRLLLINESDTIFTDIYDWQLIPITKYAGSEFNSCVSLFGPESNDYQHHIIFHEHLQNTLLGMRILQADMMLLDMSSFWQVPKYDGKPILGAGEVSDSTRNWQKAAVGIQNILARMSFRSYVMTDYGETVSLSTSNGRLEMTGEPYYHFWTIDGQAFQTVQQEKSSEIEEGFNRVNELVDSLNQMRYATPAERQELMDVYEKETARVNGLVEAFNEMEPEVIVLEELNQKMKENRNLIRSFNPLVFEAATNTMRYAALFRYLKTVDPVAWEAFLRSISDVVPEPDVKTPTTWAK